MASLLHADLGTKLERYAEALEAHGVSRPFWSVAGAGSTHDVRLGHFTARRGRHQPCRLLHFPAALRASLPCSGREPRAAAVAHNQRSAETWVCRSPSERTARSPDPPRRERSRQGSAACRRGVRCPVARTSRTPSRTRRIQPWRSQGPCRSLLRAVRARPKRLLWLHLQSASAQPPRTWVRVCLVLPEQCERPCGSAPAERRLTEPHRRARRADHRPDPHFTGVDLVVRCSPHHHGQSCCWHSSSSWPRRDATRR